MDDKTLDLKYKEILYACLEELKATKAALYLMERDGNFHLKTSYGFIKRDTLPQVHDRESPLVQTLSLERKPFYFNRLADALDLASLITSGNTTRILVAPVYLDKIIGILDIRDKAGKVPFDHQDVVVADGIALKFVRLISQQRSQADEAMQSSFDEKEERGVQIPEETIFQKVESLVSSPTQRVLNPITQPPQIFARSVRQVVDMLMRNEGFANMVIIFLSHAGTYVIQGGVVALPTSFLHKLGREAASHSRKEGQQPASDEGFFTHKYFPQGEKTVQRTLRRAAHAPVFTSSGCQVFAHIFAKDVASVKCMERLTTSIVPIRRLLTLEINDFLSTQTLEVLLEKFVDPGMDRFHALKIHSKNVASLTRDFCQQLQMNQTEVDRISTAALLHDVGMRELDYNNLYHKKHLSDEDLHLLKQHPKVGAYLIQDLPFPYDVYSLVYYHHERFDGTGYPGQLMGTDIPVGARIIHIMEAWDAMTSPDSYRPTLTPTRAVEILRSKAGIQFDGELVQRFITFIQAKNIIQA